MKETGGTQGDVGPIVELLCAHAALIQNTSDVMSSALTKGLFELQALSSEQDGKADAQIQKSLSRMMMAMQSQDILRQQVGVLMHGLKTLVEAVPPVNAEADADDWVASKLDDLRAAYVMREQYVLHEEMTGMPSPRETEADPILFD